MASAAPALRDVSLDDKYALESGRVYLTGAQAFVRLLMLQRQRDALAGLNTAGFVSGLSRLAAGRARPVAVEGREVPRARAHQVPARAERGPRRDRVVGIAAGQPVPGGEVRRRVRDVVRQGPGRRPLRRRVQARESRRHVEARRRAGARGRRPRREVVDAAAPVGPHVLGGADAGAVPVVGAGDPRPRPARLGDVALFRAAGSASSASPTPSRARRRCTSIRRARRSSCPDDFPLPPDGVSIRWPDGFLETEARMQDYKVYAALHYCRVNQLNRIVIDSPKPRLGIITSGKSYLDVRQALDDLGITEADAAEIGLRVYKIAMTVAARARRRPAVRRRARGDPRRRGEAAGRRVPAEGAALQLARRRAPARRRQVRREGRVGAPARRLAAAGAVRAHARDDRARDRAADPPSQPAVRAPSRSSTRASTGSMPRRRRSRSRRSRSSASRTSARAARTTRRPTCPRAAAPPPASAAT